MGMDTASPISSVPPDTVWPRAIGSAQASAPMFLDEGVQPPPVSTSADRTQRGASIPRLPQGVVISLPVSFHASSADYAGLWLRNLILVLLTLGLYLPWARVNSQRFLFRHTLVAGHRLDYHATPRSLAPRYGLCLSLLFGAAGAWAGSMVAGMLALSLTLAVWPLIVYMSLVHRMAHVSWAGRRLSFDGICRGVYQTLWAPLVSGAVLAWSLLGVLAWQRPGAWLAWGIFAAAWLALMPSFTMVWLTYRQHQLRMGPLKMLWKANVRAMQALWGRTLVWAALACLFGLGIGAVGLAMVVWLKGRLTPLGLSMTAAGCAVMALVAVWPYAQARMQNLVWSKTGSRYVRFRSRLSVSAYVFLQLRHLILLLLTCGLYWPWAVVASRRMRTEALVVWTRVDTDVLKANWPTHTSLMARKMAGSTAPGRSPF
jgi:uncharacterized membrane protein YjgN (DUF898 family)